MYTDPQTSSPGYSTPVTGNYATSTPPLPPTNAGWMVASILFFWPVAFAAANHSSRVYPLWAIGDYAGAQHASARAKRLGQIALLLWIVFMVLLVGLYVVMMAAVFSSIGAGGPDVEPWR